MTRPVPDAGSVLPNSFALRMPYRGERTYIQASALMEELQGHFPASHIEVQFIRPVTSSSSLMESGAGKSAFAKRLSCQVRVSGKSGADRNYVIINDPDEIPWRTGQMDLPPVRIWALGPWLFFYFSRVGEPANEIGAIFEHIQTMLGRRYVVRRMTRHHNAQDGFQLVCAHVRKQKQGDVVECQMYRGLRRWLTIKAARR
jgi:hypothetical protein